MQTASSSNKKTTHTRWIATAGAALLATAALVAGLGRRTVSAEGAARTLNASGQAATRGQNNSSVSSGPLGTDQIQSLRSLGKAYYEQGKYKDAVDAFKRVVESGQAVALDHLDLAQGLIQTNQLNQALEELTTAEEMAPANLAIHYNLGILYKHELRYTDAERELKRVIASDPNDPPTWFNLGDVYFAEHKMEPAFEAFRQVVDMGYAKAQNFYVAATFHCFIILNRLKQPAEAKKYLALNMATRNKIPNISLQYPALEAGKYGAVNIAPATLTAPGPIQAAGPITFKEITATLGVELPHVRPPAPDAYERISASEYSLAWAKRNLVPLFGGMVATGDYLGNGRQDLYVVVPGGTNHLLRNNGNGTFTDVTAKAGVGGHGGSLAAAFVDYNNSGHPSLVVAGLGGVTLYKNNGNGTFTDATAAARLKGNPGELDTGIAAFDVDNDGFVDLVVTAYTNLSNPPQKREFSFPDDFPSVVSHLYRNNGDGTFTDITSAAGLASARGHMRGAVFADFNNDGYTDLLFLRDDGPPILFMNEGQDKFTDRTAEAGDALAHSQADEAAVSDFNHDGNFDLALWSRNGYQVLLNHGGAHFMPVENLPAVPNHKSLFFPRGALADINGDSFDDILVQDAHSGWSEVVNRAGRFESRPVKLLAGARALLTGASLRPLWLNDPAKLDLVGVLPDGQLVAFELEGPPARWVEVKFEGYKSNKQGIGDIIELKSGNFYDKLQATGGPVRVFTGNLPKLDVVRVTWPNQVVQNSVDVSTDSSISVKESERLASSCPFLYVWNGERFVFLTDVLGASPLGELSPDGTYLRPNPDTIVSLGSEVKPRDGGYVFQFTDEMREVDYFDQVKLFAVDHPVNEDVYANEIYSPMPVKPAVYVLRNKRFPISAVDDHGSDVLALIRNVDGRYPTDFRRNRILGLAAPHSLTLDLGEFPQTSHVALWLKGWVFWTDSNAARALMSNHRMTMTDPYLQVRDKAGKWVTVIPDMGLPSGTDSTMRVDLTGKFLTPDHHIRIVTNLCVYWDQIFFTTSEARIQPSFVLPLVSANLHYRGFSAVRTDPLHLHPDYFDYTRLMTHAPWNPARGPYTRYGPVRPLLASADNQLVALSTGDEMTVKFTAQGLPPVKAGWKRDFFLYLRGYAKDGEPNTAFARSVNPLPFGSMGDYPTSRHAPGGASYDHYLRKYQTRPAYNLIPQLAPPAGF